MNGIFEFELLPQQALAVDNYEDACTIQNILLNNGYCVLMTTEENLFCLNWVWSENHADRNDVVFGARDEYESEWTCFEQDHPEMNR